MDDPTTMDLDQIRDWFAAHRYWNFYDGWWHRPGTSTLSHPVPATLDAIAGLMPPSVRTFKSLPTRDGNPVFYDAVDSGHLIIATVPDTGNELLDRARLAMLATLAEDRAAKQEDDDGN